MSTTTIRMSKQLRARVAKAAARSGTSAHAYILNAVAEKAEMDERRADFIAAAEQRFDRFVASGRAIPWDRMRTYLKARAAGRPARPPAARKVGRNP